MNHENPLLHLYAYYHHNAFVCKHWVALSWPDNIVAWMTVGLANSLHCPSYNFRKEGTIGLTVPWVVKVLVLVHCIHGFSHNICIYFAWFRWHWKPSESWFSRQYITLNKLAIISIFYITIRLRQYKYWLFSSLLQIVTMAIITCRVTWFMALVSNL